jgi:uncharacterized protein
MFVIEVSRIPDTGVDVDETLTPEPLHLAQENSFRLGEGGRLQCRVEIGEDRLIQVSGRLQARVQLECGRCLDPFDRELDERIDWAYLPQGADRGDEEEVHLSDRDLVVAYYEHDQIDLGEMVRQQLVLSLSMKRLCRENCRGLCPQCGANLNTTSCSCVTSTVDPRWEALQFLRAEESKRE